MNLMQPKEKQSSKVTYNLRAAFTHFPFTPKHFTLMFSIPTTHLAFSNSHQSCQTQGSLYVRERSLKIFKRDQMIEWNFWRTHSFSLFRFLLFFSIFFSSSLFFYFFKTYDWGSYKLFHQEFFIKFCLNNTSLPLFFSFANFLTKIS